MSDSNMTGEWSDHFEPTPDDLFGLGDWDWEGWISSHQNEKQWAEPLKKTPLDDLKKSAEIMYNKLISTEDGGLKCPPEIAIELSLLSLYDLVLLLDDSTSMEFTDKVTGGGKDSSGEDGGSGAQPSAGKKRKDILNDVLSLVAGVYECYREDGVLSIKWFNDSQGLKNVTKEKVGNNRIKGHKCSGVTRIGTALKKKVIDQFVFKNSSEMKKPLLVVVITDGKVEGELDGLLEHVVINCVDQCNRDNTRGSNAVSFQFAQVGRDKAAESYLRTLSKDKRVGKHIDCLINASLDYINDKGLKWDILAQLLLGAIMPQWSRHSAPLLNLNQPKGAKPLRAQCDSLGGYWEEDAEVEDEDV